MRNSEGNDNYAALVIVLNMRHHVKPYSRRNNFSTPKKYYHTGSEKKICPGRSSSQPANFSYCLSWKEDPALNEDSLLTC